MASFFERFREEIARYAPGVHHLGAPAAPAAVTGVPDAELADFLRSYNGAELFVDAYRIRPVDALEREGSVLWFGDTAAGDRLGIDLARGGAVVRLEEDTGEVVVEGSSFRRWLEGSVVADAVIWDREGEFQDELFEGEDLTPAAQAKREKKALRLDPDAAGPGWRLAKALERLGDEGGARKRLEAVVARWPDFAWAWFDLGRLRRAAGWLPEAEAAFASAATAAEAQGSEHAGFFHAHAARVAVERADEKGRARHAAAALSVDPEAARGLRRAAQQRADEDEADEALELAELATALAPRDLEAAELRRRLQAAVAKRPRGK